MSCEHDLPTGQCWECDPSLPNLSDPETRCRCYLASAREFLTKAEKELEERRGYWNEARKALVSCLRQRLPREEELTYALGATCKGCGAPMAYWADADANAWDCADVLLGRVGTPEDKALVCERGLVEQPPPPEGKVLHDRLPFGFWSVKSDRTRKTR